MSKTNQIETSDISVLSKLAHLLTDMNNDIKNTNAARNTTDLNPQVIREAIRKYREEINNADEVKLDPRISYLAEFNEKYDEKKNNEDELGNCDNTITTVGGEREQVELEISSISSMSTDVSDESSLMEPNSTDSEASSDECDPLKDESGIGIKEKNQAIAKYFEKKTEKLHIEIKLLKLKLKKSKRRYYENLC